MGDVHPLKGRFFKRPEIWVEIFNGMSTDEFLTFLKDMDPVEMKPYFDMPGVYEAYHARAMKIVQATNHIFEIHVALGK